MKEVARARSSALNLVRRRCGFVEGRWRVTALLPLPLPLGSALLVLRTRIMDALPVWRGRRTGEREESDDGRANERAGGERVMWSETRSGADAEMGGSEDRQRRRGNCSWYDWLARGRPGEKRERPKKLQNFYAASQRFSVANGKISEYRVTHLLAD